MKLYDFYVYASKAALGGTLFRLVPLAAYPHGWAVVATAIAYALAHFLFCKWQMVVVCFPLGLLLGWVFLLFDPVTGYIVCLGLHGLIGGGAWFLHKQGWLPWDLSKWMKDV